MLKQKRVANGSSRNLPRICFSFSFTQGKNPLYSAVFCYIKNFTDLVAICGGEKIVIYKVILNNENYELKPLFVIQEKTVCCC